MCGITGFTHVEGDYQPDRIHEAVVTLLHRGPDQRGVWQSAIASLGATRLRVIDTSIGPGAQPMRSADNDYVLAFNGEIYNHVEIRRELVQRGHTFVSTCDTEVVLRAFMEWDKACVEKFRGMFAFGLWHESQRRLVLVRDRLGMKPLYYSRRGRNLYFGSELKALFCHPEIERSIDLTALDSYLGLNYVPGASTLAAGIVKLGPGSCLTWQDGEVTVERYWKIPRDVTCQRSLNDSREELDFLLAESVKEHLAADVPVGLWLSGGIDSSTVLHYASRLSAKPLKTFSITFKGREFDEARYIREVAAFYDTDHYELDLNPETAGADVIEDFAYYADEPNADAGAVPIWYLSRLSAKRVTVALSGEGADELFGGYVTYLADTYARYARILPRGVRRLSLHYASQIKASDKKIGLDYKLQRFLHGTLMDASSSHVFWNGTFSREQRDAMVIAPDGFRMQKLLSTMPARGNVKRFMAFDQDYYLPDNILAKVDRMSMAHSLEVRAPYLDHRIVEFAAALPLQQCIQGNRLKVLLRELMRDKLPQSVLFKKKLGLDIPAHDWLRGHLKPLLMDTLTRETVEHSGLFHWSSIQSLLDLHMQRKANYGYHLWGLLMLFLWTKQWNIRCSQDLPLMEESSTVSA